MYQNLTISLDHAQALFLKSASNTAINYARTPLLGSCHPTFVDRLSLRQGESADTVAMK